MFLASPALAQKTTVQVKAPKHTAKHKVALRKLQQEQSGTTARVWLQQKETERIKKETERLRYMVMKDRLRLYDQAARRYRWKAGKKPRRKHQPYWQEWKYLRKQVGDYEKRHLHKHLPWLQQKAIEYGIMNAPKKTKSSVIGVRKVVRRAKKVSKPLVPTRPPSKKASAPPRPGIKK